MSFEGPPFQQNRIKHRRRRDRVGFRFAAIDGEFNLPVQSRGFDGPYAAADCDLDFQAVATAEVNPAGPDSIAGTVLPSSILTRRLLPSLLPRFALPNPVRRATSRPRWRQQFRV